MKKPSLKIRKYDLSYLIFALILFVLLYLGLAFSQQGYNPPFPHASDLTVHVPRAFKLNNPNLYSRDPVFATFGWSSFSNRLDSLPFPLLLNGMMPLLGGIRPTLIVLSFILGIIFVGGIFLLTYYVSGDPLAGVIAAVLGSLNYKVLGGVQLAFIPETVLPRTFVIAIAPLIIALFFHWQESKKLFFLFAGIGLLANFHLLSPFHLVLVLGLTQFTGLGISWSTTKKTVLAGLAATIFALPAAMIFLTSLGSVVAVTEYEAAILADRFAFALKPSNIDIILFLINFLPFAVLALLALQSQKFLNQTSATNYRLYIVFCLIVLILPWLGVLINMLTLSLVQLELLRLTRYYFLLSIIPVSVLLSSWMKSGKRYLFFLSPLLLATIILLSRPQVGSGLILVGFQWLNPEPKPVIQTSSKKELVSLDWNWEAFTELSTWTKMNTSEDALFLAPPDWNLFRVYAERSMVVSWKGTSWQGWAEYYGDAQNLYQSPTPAEFVRATNQYDADYVIVMAKLILSEFELVYENEYYRIYKTE